MDTLINIILFALLVITAIAAARTHGLFGVAMLSGVFSLLSALLLVTLDAVDVAFTEAAVGAGISTVLMLSALSLTSRHEKESSRSNLLPLLVVMFTGILLFYGTLDMPNFGEESTPAQNHVSKAYIERSPSEVGVPNIVTAILASYRGYDTMGETAVVFTAGVGVLLLLSGLQRRRRKEYKKPGKL